MKQKVILFVTIIFSSFSQAQFKKEFKDYLLLSLPQDRQLVGTIRTGVTFTGNGVSEDLLQKSRSLEKYFASDSTEFKLEVLKILNSTFKLNPNKFQIIDLDQLEITDCIDYGALPLAKNNSIVVSTIRVKSLNIKTNMLFDVDLKAELETKIQQSDIKIEPKITYTDKKASLKLGKDLIVAVKVIKINGNPKSYFFTSEKANPKGKNTYEFFEPDFNTFSQISFHSLDDLSSTLTNENDYLKHQGCFSASYINPSVTSGESQMIGGSQMICPYEYKIIGDIKLTSSYRPLAKYEGNNIFPIGVIFSGNKIIRYTFQAVEIKSINYRNYPEKDISKSNYKLNDVNLSWEVKKYVHNFSVVKK